jgi:thiamine biosynthesis lipoprotein
VQRAADQLYEAGVTDFCLTAGGDVATRGLAGAGAPWRVGIRHPYDRRAVAAIVEARHGLAVATSGAYERGEHILVPATGRPPHGVLSVTVVGPDLGKPTPTPPRPSRWVPTGRNGRSGLAPTRP